MDLVQTLGQYVPAVWTQTTAEIDAEIREELEFHLDMRTEENIRAGMAPALARRDAQERFGDFESSHRACRKITLGPRLALRRLQTTLLALLIGVVVYQAVVLVRVQQANQSQIESLKNTIDQLQAAQVSPSNELAPVPSWHWDPSLPAESLTSTLAPTVPEDWGTAPGVLDRPWCDWQALDEPPGEH